MLGRARIRLVAIVAAVVVAASCASTPPNTSPGTPSTTPPGSSSGPSAANSLAAIPRPADGSAELAALFGLPSTPLDADQAKLRDEILAQVAPGSGSVPSSHPSVRLAAENTDIGAVGVGFLIIQFGVLGRALPSKEAAELLAGMAERAAGGGRDAADSQGPEENHDSKPFSGSSGKLSGSGSMDTHIKLSSDHSLIELQLGRILTLDYTTSSDSGHLVIDIDNEESVDTCPDSSGAVPVKIHSVFTMIANEGTETATIDGKFTGQTDSQANLASITGDATIEGDTKSGSDTTKDYGATIDGMTISNGKADGTYRGSGDGVLEAIGAAAVDIENSVPQIFDQARKIWQDSGCVALEVPDLNGLASFGDGGNASVHKDVDVSSKTDFALSVHDRFRHVDANVPVKMTLSSKESIDPTTVSSLPQSVTYEAPAQPDQTNDLVLESKSLQGATRLTLHFRTKEPKLILSMKGTLKEQITVAGGTTVTVAITVTKTTFEDNGSENDQPSQKGTAHGTGQVHLTIAGVTLPCGAVTGTETGTIPLIATLATADDGTSTWSIHPDQSKANFSTKDQCILSGGLDFGAGGGFIPKALAALGDFKLPIDPGTYTVSGTRSIPVGTDAATFSVTVYPPPAK